MLEDKNTNTKMIIYLVLFGFMVLYLIFTSISDNYGSNAKKSKKVTDNVDIISLFNKIESNYNISINENIDNVLYKLNVITDSNVYLYDGSLLDKEGYIYSNGKLYYVLDNYELEETKELYSFLSDPYYNIDLIRNTIKYCNFEYEEKNKAKCKIKISDYINEYNSIYNKNYEVNHEDYLIYDINYNMNSIKNIRIDYSLVENIINNSNKSIIYEIVFNEFDDSTFKSIIDGYKKELSN